MEGFYTFLSIDLACFCFKHQWILSLRLSEFIPQSEFVLFEIRINYVALAGLKLDM